MQIKNYFDVESLLLTCILPNTKIMDALQTAILKDDVLKFLAKNPDMYIDAGVIKKDLKINTIDISVLYAYFNDMRDDDSIHFEQTKEGVSVSISDIGQKLLFEGGYTRIATEAEENSRIAKEKTKLEIQNLKLTKWLSIIAIIISISALIVSIFIK